MERIQLRKHKEKIRRKQQQRQKPGSLTKQINVKQWLNRTFPLTYAAYNAYVPTAAEKKGKGEMNMHGFWPCKLCNSTMHQGKVCKGGVNCYEG